MTEPSDNVPTTDRPRAFRIKVLLVIFSLMLLVGAVTLMAIIQVLGQIRDPANLTRAARLFVTATLKTPLGTYRIDNGDYPTTAEGLQALLTAPSGKGNTWRGPYLEVTPPDKMPRDPWGHDYFYLYPGTRNPGRYDLFSAGRDGIPGTADDIGNW
jgi:general secretion pathway protein G